MFIKFIVIIFIVLISIVAYKVKSLSGSGTFAAVMVGSAIYLGFDSNGLIILGLFFGTSSLLSFYKSKQKKSIDEKLEKGSRRDWIQVFANGGIAALCSLFYYFTHDSLWVIAFLTSIASANGDTWSSEIGPLSKRPPISVRNFKEVSHGTSGAISILGSVFAIIGVGIITLIGVLLFQLSFEMAWIIFIFGIIGNVVDTFLGAYYQRVFRCKECLVEIEKTFHCGKKAVRISGFRLLNNDGVNFLSNLMSPLLALITYLIFL